MIRRCYSCDVRPARYMAMITSDCSPRVLLCNDCAAWERQLGDILWIKSLPRDENRATT